LLTEAQETTKQFGSPPRCSVAELNGGNCLEPLVAVKLFGTHNYCHVTQWTVSLLVGHPIGHVRSPEADLAEGGGPVVVYRTGTLDTAHRVLGSPRHFSLSDLVVCSSTACCSVVPCRAALVAVVESLPHTTQE
jgi:hypothetical protein